MDEEIQEGPLLSKEQKTGLALLGVVTVLILALWVVQMRYTIYSPFSFQIAKSAEKRLSEQAKSVEDMVLERRDTDQDGLTDTEELELYGTSAYLPDTDSDGLTDQQEVALGSDPNCPKDSVCEASADSLPRNTTTDTPFSDLIDGQQNPLDTLAVGAALGTTSSSAVSSQLSSIAENPEMIRAMLLETGQFSAKDLSAIPDATLIEIAKNILQSNTIPPVPSSP